MKIENAQSLPSDTASRKNLPMAQGLLDYFPAALAEVAAVSKAGNDKHNPGEDMHWARGKSMDHADCILRHLVDRGTLDAEDGLRHSAKVAWRALALLQEELEREAGAPMPRGARLAVEVKPEFANASGGMSEPQIPVLRRRIQTDTYSPLCVKGSRCDICYRDAEPDE